jgi:5-hydroxyisourate hydrolase
MARISTHVLDIAKGAPAAGIPVTLLHDGKLLASGKTNADGRTDQPLVTAARIEPGLYELVFRTGDYLRSTGIPDPLFLDEITIRFGAGDPEGNYHVPLLLAANGYSTYRGS